MHSLKENHFFGPLLLEPQMHHWRSRIRLGQILLFCFSCITPFGTLTKDNIYSLGHVTQLHTLQHQKKKNLDSRCSIWEGSFSKLGVKSLPYEPVCGLLLFYQASYPSTVLQSRERSETIPNCLASLEMEFLWLLATMTTSSNCGTNLRWINSCNWNKIEG